MGAFSSRDAAVAIQGKLKAGPNGLHLGRSLRGPGQGRKGGMGGDVNGSADEGEALDSWGARFPRELRVCRSDDYRRTLDQGVHAADGTLVVIVARNGLSHSRLGTIVSRQVGNSVVRHRWKRLIREAFRRRRLDLPKGLDIVAKPKRGARDDGHAVAQSLVPLVRRALRKLGPRPE